MSAVVAGVSAGALGSVGFGFSAWVAGRRRSPKADFRRADRFARAMDLYLPLELVAEVAARLSRRAVRGLALSALTAGPILGYLVGTFVALWDGPVGPTDNRAVPFPGPASFALGLTYGILITTLEGVLEGVWDLSRTRREAPLVVELSIQPLIAVQLRHVVAVWVIWAARVLAVLPALAAGVACAAQGRTGLALGFIALALLCCLVVWSAERLQLWMLNTGRRAVRSGLLPQQAAAFDDAFRVTSALPLVMLAPCVCETAGAFYIHMAGRGLWYEGLMLTWMLITFPLIGLNGLLNSAWAKRYHRRGIRKLPAPTPA